MQNLGEKIKITDMGRLNKTKGEYLRIVLDNRLKPHSEKPGFTYLESRRFVDFFRGTFHLKEYTNETKSH
jgi:hypothetical protein